MKEIDDVERAAFHKMLDDAIDARNRRDTDPFAREQLMSWATLLFKRVVGQHGIELHGQDNPIGSDPENKLGRLISIVRWAAQTLPGNGNGHILSDEAYQIAEELEDLLSTAPNRAFDWLQPQGRKEENAEETRYQALAVSWAVAVANILGNGGKVQKGLAQNDVAAAFGVTDKTIRTWANQIRNKPNFKAQVEVAWLGDHTCGIIVDHDRNIMVFDSNYAPHLKRHGEQYKNFVAKKA